MKITEITNIKFLKLDHSIRKDHEESQADDDMDLPFFDLLSIAAATCEFSADRKIGEGGFGPVYQVILFTT